MVSNESSPSQGRRTRNYVVVASANAVCKKGFFIIREALYKNKFNNKPCL